MKPLNTMKFMMNFAEEFTKAIERIDNAENMEIAVKLANKAMGMIDTLDIFGNCMVCKENNDFTGDLGAMIDEYRAAITQTLITKHFRGNSDVDQETVEKWIKMRKEYTESAEEQWA